MNKNLNDLLIKATVAEDIYEAISDYYLKLLESLICMEEALSLLSKTNFISRCFTVTSNKKTPVEVILRDLLTSVFDEYQNSQQPTHAIEVLYSSNKNSDVVRCLKSIIMQTYKRLECMENKPPLHPSCDILATKQLDHVRAFLEINQRRNHLFHLSAELQKLKENVLKEDSTFQSDIEEKLHLIEVKSKIEYLERRVLELMSRVKCKKEYVSRVNSVAVIWKKIASLHEENENLLGNLPVLCSETKQYRHQVSCQLVDFHEAANEFLSSDLLQGVDDHFQTPSNDETLPSNDNFVRTLQCDSLYRRCCILFSLDPNITMPDVLLETVLNLVQNFRRAEQKLTLLSDLNDNFNRKCLDGQKIQEQDTKVQRKTSRRLEPVLTQVKAKVEKIKQHISFCKGFLSDWKELPICQMMKKQPS